MKSKALPKLLLPILSLAVFPVTAETDSRIAAGYTEGSVSLGLRTVDSFGVWVVGLDMLLAFPDSGVSVVETDSPGSDGQNPVERYAVFFDSPVLLAGAVQSGEWWPVLDSFDARSLRLSYVGTDKNSDEVIADAPAAGAGNGNQPSRMLQPAASGQMPRSWGVELDLPGLAGLWALQTVSGQGEGWGRLGFGLEHSFAVARGAKLEASLRLTRSVLGLGIFGARDDEDWWPEKPLIQSSELLHAQAGVRYAGDRWRAGMVAQTAFAPFMSPGVGALAWFGTIFESGNRRVLSIDADGFFSTENWIDTYGNIRNGKAGARLDLETRPLSWIGISFNNEFVSTAVAGTAKTLPENVPTYRSKLSLSLGPSACYLRAVAGAEIGDARNMRTDWLLDGSAHLKLHDKTAGLTFTLGGTASFLPRKQDLVSLYADIGFAAAWFGWEASFACKAPSYYFKGWGTADELQLRFSTTINVDTGKNVPVFKLGLKLKEDTDYADLEHIAEGGFFSVFVLDFECELNTV